MVSLVGASKPFAFANLVTAPEIQSTSSGSPFSRSTAVDALTSGGSSFTIAQMSCSTEEERFIPYARAVAVVSDIIFWKTLLKEVDLITWPRVQRPAAVAPEIAENTINLDHTSLSISLVTGAKAPAFVIAF